ncbi:hypothetical protein N183_36885 [Sinorhizobium sp. Sb3]|uniref:hypothetical protein n=1 Tax=Sinorhizobium sp. Sb3 TaxID=1358417 RepID=UPI00072BF242|nr:hypothetical protein [Sinorhizobium sp. Sb3]KSV61859.1 hypothetical protein N183_36885 [Sinorhizobium sp. Sb3]
MNLLTRLAGIIGRSRTPDFVSFWHGPMDGLAYGCLASFPYYGARLRLYSYDHNIHVPPGVDLADAREICPDTSLTGRYIAEGKVEFAKFSNLFRYLVIRQTGCCWVDSDLLCLRAPTFQHDEMVFGYQYPKEHPQAMNGAVLRLPREHAVLADLIQVARAAVDLDQRWGTIGPYLITTKFNESGLSQFASPAAEYYPLPPVDFWKMILPEGRESVEATTHASKLIHLWHKKFEITGYNKKLAPPRGAYLHSAFERVGGLGGFTGIYEAEELRVQLARWLPSAKVRP